MDLSLNLDLIDFHPPKDDQIFKSKSDRWLLFRAIRFKNAGDGEYAVLRMLDLANHNLNDFIASWLVFTQCNLDNVSFHNTNFSHTVFINCSMKNTDFTNTVSSNALFIECDLTGLKISPLKPYTQWVSEDLDGKTMPSIFDGCKMDRATKAFLIENKCLVGCAGLDQGQRLDVLGEMNNTLSRVITAPILDL